MHLITNLSAIFNTLFALNLNTYKIFFYIHIKSNSQKNKNFKNTLFACEEVRS